jgi:TonB-linked SusC/RagA family outer membrane protein
VKGTSVGTTTNSDGTFTLTVPAKAKTLVFSSVGMETNEVFIGSGLQFNTQMRPASNDLAEVVVSVPYGTVKKTAFTGSEATINSGALKKQQVTSVTKALEGLIPGIVTTNGGGAPGSNASVLIRGVGSYQGSSAPLYVLDGVPYAGSISALSMDDIESVTVLKDAAASALYGSRAANGVIMITTKKGRRGRSNISATYRQGFESRAIPEYDRVGPKDYYELMWEATRNKYIFSGQTPAQAGQSASAQLTGTSGLVYNAYNVPGAQLVDPVTGKLDPNAKLLYNESWEDALFRTASRENANVSISGGADKSDYFFSAGYLNEEGMARFTGLKRYNTRLNLNTQANDWLKAGISIDGSVVNTSNLLATGTYTTNPFYYARMMGPIYPVYQHDATGAYVLGPDGQPALDWGVPSQMGARPYSPNSNLVGSLALDDRSDKTLNGNANAYLDISFLKNFSFKTTMGTNYYDDYATTYQNSQYGDAQNVRGRSTKTTTRQLSYTLNEVLSWNKKFGDHSVRALAGHENYYLNINSANATRIGFPFPGTTELNTAATSESSGSYEDNLRIESYFTGVNYSYKEKYLASASYRRDGTSRFAADNRWGNFYSAGLGWRISQEEFLKNVSWINELKLKASYGETGNQELYNNGSPIYYAYQNLYNLGYNNVNNPGAIVGAPSNPALVWEGNKQLNIGTDFTILKNRLQGSIEWFNRISDNLLFGVPLAASTGYSPAQINENIGALKNTGVELQLGYNAIRQKNFDWRIDLNLTHFKNEFTKLPPGQTEIISGTKKIMVGHSIYDFWIKEYAGVDAATGDALFYQDVLGTDGKPTGQRVLTNNYSKASYYYEGSAIPDLTGGLTNSFRYGNFDLSFLLTFSYGGKFYDQNFQALMHAGSYGTAWATEILNRWQKPGDVTNVPRLQNAVANQDGTSTRWLFDASWLNVKNVTLSYNLSRSLASRMRVSGVQIFGNIDNAYLFTSHKGMDPQRAFNGTSDWSYAPVRTVTFGLNVNL